LPVFFIDIPDGEEKCFESCPLYVRTEKRTDGRHSTWNPVEVETALPFLMKLVEQHKLRPESITTISPYRGQSAFFRNKLSKTLKDEEFFKRFSVDSVERLQSTQRKAVLFLTTRTSKIGFMDDPQVS
jgi:superfamily I DNA and/or RNA helicase